MSVFFARIDAVNPPVGSKVVVRAGLYEVRFLAFDTVEDNLELARHANATVSGGTVIPLSAYREGAPAASATLRYGESGVSITGGPSTPFGTSFESGDGFHRFTPYSDLTIAPGSAFSLTWSYAGNFQAYHFLYIEELLLSWHY